MSSRAALPRLFRLSPLFIVTWAVLALAGPARAQQAQAPAAKPWWERITFSGDFRGRYEGFYQEARPTRHRERFRLRLALATAVNDEVNAGIRLASGEPTDLASTNQSFTEFLNRKTINIDQAFITYNPKAAKPLTVGLGKFPFPVTRTQMVWDDDINWEGTFEQLVFAGPGGVSLKLVAVQSPINEISGDDDAFMFGEYAQINLKAGPHTLQFSVGDYNFRQEDQIAVAVEAFGLRNPNSNRLTRNAAGRVTGFLSGFNLVDVIAQATFTTPKADYPLTLLADWATNTRAADEKVGIWLLGALGRAARPRTGAVSYTFARIEQDAVLGTFNYSDMPPTNAWVNILALSYMPLARWNVDFTAILSKPIRPSGSSADNLLKRIQIDTRVTF